MERRSRELIGLAALLALTAMAVQAQTGMKPDLRLSASLDAMNEAIRVCSAMSES